MSRLIAAYLADFDHHLGFDRSLKRRARAEIAGHLADAAAAEAGVAPDEAERRAIARFGPAAGIAAGMIDATRPARVRGARNTGLLLITALFLFMRLRSMWMADGVIATGPEFDIAVMVDRLAFGMALTIGGIGWWLSRKAGLTPLLRLSLIAAAAFALSIAAGAFIAAALAVEPVKSVEALILLWAAPLEIALLGLLIGRLRLLARYQAHDSAVCA